MKKPIQVVMLPTKDFSYISKAYLANPSYLRYSEKGFEYDSYYNNDNQHIYITVSQNVEPIKEGDWIINKPSNKLHQVKDIKYLYESDRKIIATDDKSLSFYEHLPSKSYTGSVSIMKNVPQVPQSFLKEYVANPDGEWEVEYEEIIKCYKCGKLEEDCIDTSPNCLGYFEGNDKLKLNQDNTVNITSVKEKMYNEKQIRLAFQAGARYGYCKRSIMSNIGATCKEPDEDNWIKENL
jgi:hypothetical protein